MCRGDIRSMCSPFLRGFLPGVIVGLLTSLLFFSLWRHPPVTGTEKRDGMTVTAHREAQGFTERFMPEADRVRELVEASNTVIPGGFAVLVLIHSSAAQRSLRDAVRKTWLYRRSRRGAYVARFVLGTRALDEDTIARLAEENEQHRDVIVLPQVEEELDVEWPSSEKLVHAFSWAVSHVDFRAIFKCNTATFALLDNIVDKLQNRHIWGYFAGGVRAVRHSETAVLVEEDWTLCSHYLPYPQGGGYVISRDLVELVVEMGPDLKHYRHDDIAMGVWLSPFRDIVKQHSVLFNTGYYSRGCMNSYLVTHRETVDSMHTKYTSLKRKGVLCETETQTRLSYQYNWTAPASHCCIRKIGIP